MELTNPDVPKEVLSRSVDPGLKRVDTTFEAHYSVGDLAVHWRLGRETVRRLVKDEPGVLKIRLGSRQVMTRYSVPESVARRIHTRLFESFPDGR